jgi:RAT1-interacting protein
MTSAELKRSISELLNGEEDASQNPATRRKIVQDIHRPIPRESGTTKEYVKPQAAFLAYPDLSNPKPVSVPFQQPSQLISFSYDASHIQGFDDSALRYFVQPRLKSDLSYGYERWIKRPDERGRIDALLKAFTKAKKDGVSKGIQFPEIGVVSWRGVITKYVFISGSLPLFMPVETGS